MALPISIERILVKKDVEQNRIEYKKGWDPEPIVHSVCAFANDYKGKVVRDSNGATISLLFVARLLSEAF